MSELEHRMKQKNEENCSIISEMQEKLADATDKIKQANVAPKNVIFI